MIVEALLLTTIVSSALIGPIAELLLGAAAADFFSRLPRKLSVGGLTIEVEDFLDKDGKLATQFDVVTASTANGQQKLVLTKSEFQLLQLAQYAEQQKMAVGPALHQLMQERVEEIARAASRRVRK